MIRQPFDQQLVPRQAREDRAVAQLAGPHFYTLEVRDGDFCAAGHQVFTADADTIRAGSDRGRDPATAIWPKLTEVPPGTRKRTEREQQHVGKPCRHGFRTNFIPTGFIAEEISFLLPVNDDNQQTSEII